MIVRYRASDTADMTWFQGQVVTMDDHLELQYIRTPFDMNLVDTAPLNEVSSRHLRGLGTKLDTVSWRSGPFKVDSPEGEYTIMASVQQERNKMRLGSCRCRGE